MVQVPDIDPITDTQDLRLLYAARDGASREVETLIESGVDVNSQDANGVTPLIFAAMSGHVKIVEALLAAGADPDREDALGYTAYKAAMLYGDFRGATQPPHDEIMARLGLFVEDGHGSRALDVEREMREAGYRRLESIDLLPIQIFEIFDSAP
jgi:ankyrin repeat protein